MLKHQYGQSKNAVSMASATHIDSVQHTGRYVGFVEKQTTQYVVCRSNNGKRGTMHDKEKEATNGNEIGMVNIFSISFSSKWLIIEAKFKPSSNQNSPIIPYTNETGSDENILSIHILKILFPKVMIE